MDYADTSFLVSLYVTDRHSVEARRRVQAIAHLWFTPLHRAEWTHAVAQHVFRGVLASPEVDEIYDQFAQDETAGLWNEVAMPENAFTLCTELARRHGSKLGIRTLDSLHVACALELKAERFWTLDERQAKLAKAEGLRTA
jgi:predicted nucleic acid-binding protein